MSLFDAPSPWGPWSTFDYEEQFDNTNCGGNCLGNQPAVGWSMMQKWFSADGLSLWVQYSAENAYDSLNLIRGTMSLAAGSTINHLKISTGTPAVLDNMALSSLTLIADTRKLYQMRYVDLPGSYYQAYFDALSTAHYFDQAMISHLGEIDSLEKPAVIADFLLRLDKVQWSMATAINEGRLVYDGAAKGLTEKYGALDQAFHKLTAQTAAA